MAEPPKVEEPIEEVPKHEEAYNPVSVPAPYPQPVPAPNPNQIIAGEGQNIGSEEGGEKEAPGRKYSSPPASIYDENTEDGRIRISEEGGNVDSFSVSDPVKGSHVTYTVRGHDDDGPFEGSKRYNDFFNLRSVLLQRWPGVYIPPIPPKAIRNKDDRFLLERKHFLERFLILTSKIDHIMKSDEFRLFSRPSGEIDKAAALLPAVSPDFLLERYKNNLNLSEEVDAHDQVDNKALINDYQSFCKTFMKTLKHMRDSTKNFVGDGDKLNDNYKEMMNLFTKFEENVLLEF